MKIYAHKFFILIFIPIAQQLNAILNFFRIYTRKRFKRVRARRWNKTRRKFDLNLCFISFILRRNKQEATASRAFFNYEFTVAEQWNTQRRRSKIVYKGVRIWHKRAQTHTHQKTRQSWLYWEERNKNRKNVVKLLCPS